MSNFSKNLKYLLSRQSTASVKAFAAKLGIHRSTVSRLINEQRPPTEAHREQIARAFGTFASDDLLKDPATFKSIFATGSPPPESLLHGLNVLSKNLGRCWEGREVYPGQYVLYSPSLRENIVIASLLEIGEVSRKGFEVRIINPYNGHDGDYLAFEYTGFMVPVSEFLYVFAEQTTGDYEVMSLVLHDVPVPPAIILEGLWSGVGVDRNRKFIAAVPVVAVRRRERIKDWKSKLDKELGYLPIGRVPEIVRRKMTANGILIMS